MKVYTAIEKKLHQFTQKYYKNELIKGSILFLSLGLLYLFFTLFVEFFLWLSPNVRTLLFWSFVLVEIALLTKFIVLPVSKLLGMRKGLTEIEAANIIGKHFPEVSDKLLNIIQLKHHAIQSDLILASIDQKSIELHPIPFTRAIDFRKNLPYLKYALIPIVIFAIALVSKSTKDLQSSFERVIKHRMAFAPPAPFQFELLTKDLQVVQGADIDIDVRTQGNVVPAEVRIVYNEQQYYVQKDQNSFRHTFENVQEPIRFYFIANNVQSELYTVDVIDAPTISNIELQLDYPNYLGRKPESTQNNARVVVPEGTRIQWLVNTIRTTKVEFIENEKRTVFSETSKNKFQYQKQVKQSFGYQISSSNEHLTDYETLDFSIAVIKDEAPKMSVITDIDSITRGDAQFAGQISDDYGIRKLQVTYYNTSTPNQKETVALPVTKENVQSFYYQFPGEIPLEEGENYKLYFEVYDNDAINRYKKTASQEYTYRQKTQKEIKEEVLQEQKSTIQTIENTLENQEQQQEELKELQFSLQNKKDMNWNDKKKLDNFVKRQQQYKQMMRRQTQNLLQNLDEMNENNTELTQQKELLKERILELQKLEKQQRLLDEIQKIGDKLNKEDLVKKAKELAQQNRQQQRSLEKMLEMVKRFYVEQKTMQIANTIESLSKEQQSLVHKEDLYKDAQESIKKQFEFVSDELKELEKDNEKLKDPIDLPDVQLEEQQVKSALNEVKQRQEQNQQENTKRSQRKVAQKMKEMSTKMQQSMLEMQNQSMEENMDDLRKILENLILFSFEQEQLMNQFEAINTTHPSFGKSLQKQNDIKTYFNHIDDSLYVLAMRVTDISTTIQDDLSSVHYNIDQSLENFSENRFSQGIANQRYVMTSTNNLADYLSNILNSMQNNLSMKMGNGQKKNTNNFSLPDLIQKQEQLSNKMKEGLQKPGEKGNSQEKGEQQGNSEGVDGELYKMYKEQSILRQELEQVLNENGINSKEAKKVLKTMEDLENEILQNGFKKEVYEQMQLLNYQLLKLRDASFQQGVQQKRKSTTNSSSYPPKSGKTSIFKKRYLNQLEILNRQSLPLQQNYKKKVRRYFSNQKEQ